MKQGLDVIEKAALAEGQSATMRPAHAQVYETLRDQVLSGELVPGQAVTIQGLTERLNAGVTPVREAIRRLISDGALVWQGNRRVIVPQITVSDLEQLIFLRKTIECELAMRAAPRITQPCLQKLQLLDDHLDQAIQVGDVRGYLVNNYQFHRAIYTAAQAPVLAEVAERLWLRFGPSLRVVCGRFGTQNLPDRHKELMGALAKGQGEAAAQAMAEDIAQGMEQIAEVIAP